MEILAGTKFLDKEYATAKKRTIQRNAGRAKKLWLPQLNERDRDKASTHVNSMFEKLRNSRGSPGQAA